MALLLTPLTTSSPAFLYSQIMIVMTDTRTGRWTTKLHLHHHLQPSNCISSTYLFSLSWTPFNQFSYQNQFSQKSSFSLEPSLSDQQTVCSTLFILALHRSPLPSNSELLSTIWKFVLIFSKFLQQTSYFTLLPFHLQAHSCNSNTFTGKLCLLRRKLQSNSVNEQLQPQSSLQQIPSHAHSFNLATFSTTSNTLLIFLFFLLFLR